MDVPRVLLIVALVLSFCAAIFQVIALASPYWITQEVKKLPGSEWASQDLAFLDLSKFSENHNPLISTGIKIHSGSWESCAESDTFIKIRICTSILDDIKIGNKFPFI
jgi:hypothetical protein